MSLPTFTTDGGLSDSAQVEDPDNKSLFRIECEIDNKPSSLHSQLFSITFSPWDNKGNSLHFWLLKTRLTGEMVEPSNSILTWSGETQISNTCKYISNTSNKWISIYYIFPPKTSILQRGKGKKKHRKKKSNSQWVCGWVFLLLLCSALLSNWPQSTDSNGQAEEHTSALWVMQYVLFITLTPRQERVRAILPSEQNTAHRIPPVFRGFLVGMPFPPWPEVPLIFAFNEQKLSPKIFF